MERAMISIRQLLLVVCAFVCVPQAIGQSVTAPPQKSDRERHGLRGPVEECDVKTTILPQNQGETTDTFSYVSKYDRDGRIYQRIEYNDSESFTYDAGGHLLRALSVAQDGTSDLIYTYDAQGRLNHVVGEKDSTTTFEYDNQGRKTRIVKSSLKPLSPYRTEIPGEVDLVPYGEMLIGIENGDMDGIPPDGGLIRTSFNDRGQAIESQVYDLDGELTRRLTETYDAAGRAIEFSVIDMKSVFLWPEGHNLLKANPAAYEDVKYGLAERLSYSYDDEGRVVEKRDYQGWYQKTTVTKITYNDHGDEAQTIETTYDGDLNQPQTADGTGLSREEPDSRPAAPEPNVVRLNYQYDSFGNWIERTVNSLHSADEIRISTVTHRTITYY
jgi:YD repeat-containing protein